MNPTSLTAVIITFHNLAAVAALVISVVLSLMVFWLFYKLRKQKSWLMAITFLFTLIVGITLAEQLFQKKPISIEVVQAG